MNLFSYLAICDFIMSMLSTDLSEWFETIPDDIILSILGYLCYKSKIWDICYLAITNKKFGRCLTISKISSVEPLKLVNYPKINDKILCNNLCYVKSSKLSHNFVFTDVSIDSVTILFSLFTKKRKFME